MPQLDSSWADVQVEAPAPGHGEKYDLLATKGGQRVAYEMTAHKTNVCDNIRKAKLDKSLTGSMFVTMTKKDADSLTHKHGNDIDFRPIWKLAKGWGFD